MLHEILHELKSKKLEGVIMKIDFEKAYDSVKWEFVEQVMARKDFDPKLQQWIMSTIKGGKFVSILMARMGHTLKLMRQGDPLSPLMFNLAADALDHILTKAKHEGFIKGSVLHLIPRGSLIYNTLMIQW
jgi:hypothetical protein